MLELRELSVEDDLDAYNVENPTWPGAQFQRERAAHSRDVTATMVGAELDRRPAGFLLAVALPIRAGGRCFGALYVQPWARHQGVGTRLHARLKSIVADYGFPGIQVAAQEDLGSLAVLRRWGHPIVGRHYESELDLTTLDESAVATALARAAGAAVELSLLAVGEQVAEADLRAVYPFFIERFREAPDASGATGDMPFPVFAGFISQPWRLLLARRGGELVGMTGVTPRDDRTINTFFTGVHPEHRGLGIATAVKARHAQLLRDRGYQRLVTQNMDVNAPILAANDSLGFRRLHSYVDVQIDVPVEPAVDSRAT